MQPAATSIQPPPNDRRSGAGYRRLVLFALLLGGLIFWSGYHKTPLGAADGASLNGTATRPMPAGNTIRVGIFNIDGGVGLDERRDLDRTAACMHGCDLVGLCEVHGTSGGDSRDNAQVLGEKLGLAWLFVPAERRWWRDAFGNGLLSDIPVSHWQRFPISGAQARDNRSILLARVPYHGRTVNILIAHIEHADLQMQLREVIELFRSLAEPALLMGDFNSRDDEPQLVQLLKTDGVVDAVSHAPIDQTRGHVDWILARGMRCLNAGVVPKGASDHPFYWADMELPEAVQNPVTSLDPAARPAAK